MLNELNFQDILRALMGSHFLLTGLILAGGVLLLRLANRSIQHAFRDHANPLDARRRALNAIRNAIIAVSGLLIFQLWNDELRSILFSIAAIGAGLLIVNKEAIMNVSGGFHRAILGLYSTGDFIQVGEFSGKVLAYDMTTTTLLEKGAAGLFTGVTIRIPNSLLITHGVRHWAATGRYSMEMVRVPVAATEPIARHKACLKAAGEEVCQAYLDDAAAHFQKWESSSMVALPSVRPAVFIDPVNEKQVDLVLRLPVPTENRVKHIQRALDGYYGRVAENTLKKEEELARRQEESATV